MAWRRPAPALPGRRLAAVQSGPGKLVVAEMHWVNQLGAPTDQVLKRETGMVGVRSRARARVAASLTPNQSPRPGPRSLAGPRAQAQPPATDLLLHRLPPVVILCGIFQRVACRHIPEFLGAVPVLLGWWLGWVGLSWVGLRRRAGLSTVRSEHGRTFWRTRSEYSECNGTYLTSTISLNRTLRLPGGMPAPGVLIFAPSVADSDIDRGNEP